MGHASRYIAWADRLIASPNFTWENIIPAATWCHCDSEYHVATSIADMMLTTEYPKLVEFWRETNIYVYDKQTRVIYVFELELIENDAKVHNERYRVAVPGREAIKSKPMKNANEAMLWRAGYANNV